MARAVFCRVGKFHSCVIYSHEKRLDHHRCITSLCQLSSSEYDASGADTRVVAAVEPHPLACTRPPRPRPPRPTAGLVEFSCAILAPPPPPRPWPPLLLPLLLPPPPRAPLRPDPRPRPLPSAPCDRPPRPPLSVPAEPPQPPCTRPFRRFDDSVVSLSTVSDSS